MSNDLICIFGLIIALSIICLLVFNLQKKAPKKETGKLDRMTKSCYYATQILAVSLIVVFKFSSGFSIATHILSTLTLLSAITTLFKSIQLEGTTVKIRMGLVIVLVIALNIITAFVM